MDKFLKEAIEENNVAVVEGLLDQNPSRLKSRDRDGFTPLMLAVITEERSVECVRALIDYGADVNAQCEGGFTALHWVVSDCGRIPRPWAATTEQLVRLLVDAGAQLETRNSWGWTPLMKAVDDRYLKGTDALLEVGANPNTICAGVTILSNAALWPAGMDALIQGGADVNLRDEQGRTALEIVQEVETQCFRPEKLKCIELLTHAQESDEITSG